MRIAKIVTTAAICLLIVGRGFCADEPRLEKNDERAALDQMQGKTAPALTVKNWINSKPLKLEDLKGKIVVLEFWATWCTTCLASVPHHNDLAKKYAKDGVILIGVCDQEGSEKMAAAAKKFGIHYPIAADVDDATFKAYKSDSTPDYYLIDRKGKLRWADIETDDLEKGIELLVHEK
jgi:peroxiredoxin